jgi:thiosulfate dehydrogenase [quinone] large subunit
MKYGLVAIGGCLMLGIFTRWAAIAAALQLLMFYVAAPPWPGMPGASMGGHYLYVDRNLIELIAAGAIAATAGGRHESQRAATEDRTGQLLRRPETDAA